MQKPQNIKGMRDHLPPAMLLRQHIISTLVAVFERYGFDPLSTPIVEYAETLAGKLGDDEKLMYHFDDHGGRKLALRYDQTVPLARVVAQYASQLILPWRRYAIGPSYRGERPARGRYREFWQADIDIVGNDSPCADAEIVAILTDCLLALGFTDFTTMINHRQVLGGIARASGLGEDAANQVYRVIDKLDKIGATGVQQELVQSGISSAQAERIVAMVMVEGPSETILATLTHHLQGDAVATAALDNLRAVIKTLDQMGISPDHYQLSPRLARGLSYYTGTVFEAVSAHWTQGSLLGGGRYDNLIGMFAKTPVPTVGLAFGIDRLHDVMEELAIGPRAKTTAQVFVTLFSLEHSAVAFALARELRDTGLHVITALDGNIPLGKQFKEADRKGVRFALVLGPDELAHQSVVVKDLAVGEQRTIARHQVAAVLTAMVQAQR
jgi:histidyl-tRNA synthetase